MTAGGTAQPIVLAPILKPRVWGGQRLAAFGLDLPLDARIGEAWLLADLPESVENGRSTVESGPWQGQTLHELLRAGRSEWMGDAALGADDRFPLLVKLLDARENLSVQVHPTPAYARSHPGTYRKSEAWIVLQAGPGSVIYKGLRAGVTREAFLEHLRAGTVPDALEAVPARPGDCHYLPSGTCHALGAGVLVAEVQTTSDTTFRLYDWGRLDRPLHIDEALACMDFTPPRSATAPTIIDAGDVRTTRLVDTPDFSIERLVAVRRTRFELPTSNRPIVLLPLEGTAVVETPEGTITAAPGRALVVPASNRSGLLRLDNSSTILRVDVPGPADHMIDGTGAIA